MAAYQQEKELVREAARLAGQLCMVVRRGMLGDAPDENRIEKAGKEPVTIADYGAQAIILHQIAQHFPNDATIAEERGAELRSLASEEQQAQVARFAGETLGQEISVTDLHNWLDFGRGQESARVWTIDPIDGTKGFLRGDQFAVAIALLIDGEPVVGALGCPLLPVDPADPDGARGVIAVAVRGQGAEIEPFEAGLASTRPLAVSAQTDPRLSRTMESFESDHTDHGFSAELLARVGIGQEPVRMDSQAKYVAVADGRAEMYLRNSRSGYREKIWDHAAGVLVVLEAGGRVTDLDGKPLDFSLGDRLSANWGVLATNAAFHDRLLETIQVLEAED